MNSDVFFFCRLEDLVLLQGLLSMLSKFPIEQPAFYSSSMFREVGLLVQP